MTQSLPPRKQKAKQKIHRDYCLFMDGSKYNRNVACKIHDNAYGIHGGGSEKDRAKADKEFFQHLKAHKDPMAYIAYFVVRFYGWFFFNYQRSMLWKGQLVKRLFPKFFRNNKNKKQENS